jgi:hypothetical protein
MNSTKNLSRRAGLLYVLVSRSQGTQSSLVHSTRGGEPPTPHFFLGAKSAARRTRLGFSLYPHPAASPARRSFAAGVEFPFLHLP